MRKLWLFVALIVALMAVAPASSPALSKSKAVTAAKGWQKFACGSVHGYRCLSWNALGPMCHGPTGGGIQWTCDGDTLERFNGGSGFCDVESSWSSGGKMVHWFRASNHNGCHGNLQNVRRRVIAAVVGGCARRFTVAFAQRRVRSTFAGTRTVSSGERSRLRVLVRCQRNPRARPFVRWYWRSRERAWQLRRHPPAPPFRGPVIASWFDDSGTTGCGFHATYGIATFVVPCGGHVTLRHGSRTVVATREDSGPYVAGRTFDLNPATKAALGCSDLCSVAYR